MLVSIELNTDQVMHHKFNIVEMFCIICKVHVECLYVGSLARLGTIYKVYVEFLQVKLSRNSMNGLPSSGHHLLMLQTKHIRKCPRAYHCCKGIANWIEKKSTWLFTTLGALQTNQKTKVIYCILLLLQQSLSANWELEFYDICICSWDIYFVLLEIACLY